MRVRTDRYSKPAPSARPHLLIPGLAVCFGVLSLLSQSFAQRAVRTPVPATAPGAPRQAAVQIEGLMISYSPNSARIRLSDMGSSSYRQGNWMRIMIQFATQPDWIDEVRFDCYILLRDGGQETLLTGSLTCTHVRAGRRRLACLFVPPSVLDRYGGRASAIAVECYYQNSMVSDYTIPRTARKWWQEYTGVPNTMVTWYYTPFSRDGIEAYEQVKIAVQGF